ncbi:MAG: hypothetical protein ABTR07_05380 [Candidatus Competibacter denitrificans]
MRIDAEKLQNLLNKSITYQGIPCQVIEILPLEPALVLLDCRDQKVLQANQYGDAGYWAPQTFTVALLDAQNQGFNPDLPELATFDLSA